MLSSLVRNQGIYLLLKIELQQLFQFKKREADDVVVVAGDFGDHFAAFAFDAEGSGDLEGIFLGGEGVDFGGGHFFDGEFGEDVRG